MKQPRSRAKMAAYFGGAVLFAGWMQQSGVSTMFELRDAWRQEAVLQEEVVTLEQDINRLSSEIEELSGNGKAIERIAREQFRMARDGEIIVLVPEKE